MSRKIGLIAEDKSDIETIKILIRKIGKKPFSAPHFVGHGCGKIKSKSFEWARNLKQRGCDSLILVHDLDRNDADDLEAVLREELDPCPIANHLISIPVQELEAWLLADSAAIMAALNLKALPKRVANPEQIVDPKENLSQVVYLKSEKSKYYVNTIHNAKIASHCTLTELRRCSSFVPFERFVSTLF